MNDINRSNRINFSSIVIAGSEAVGNSIGVNLVFRNRFGIPVDILNFFVTLVLPGSF